MARRTARRGKSATASLGGILLIVVAIAGFAGVGYVYWQAHQAPGLDETSLCPRDGVKGHLAILLDTTDPLTLTHLQAARQLLADKISQAPVGTRISFSTVSPDSGVRASAFFSICKPPSGKEASALTQNPGLVEATFQREFLVPVEQALDSLLEIPEAKSSPIMEALQEFASAIPGFAVTTVPRELVMMTDLMQHSPIFSFYRNGTWQSFKNAHGPERFGFAFEGAEVTVLRIPRAPDKTKIVDDFWVRYFDANGFARVRVRRIGDL